MVDAILYWKESPIGSIVQIQDDFLASSGTFFPSMRSGPLRPFFDFMVDEDEARDPLEVFDPDLLNPENWKLVDEEGRERGIEVPAVHWNEHSIHWRYR